MEQTRSWHYVQIGNNKTKNKKAQIYKHNKLKTHKVVCSLNYFIYSLYSSTIEHNTISVIV